MKGRSVLGLSSAQNDSVFKITTEITVIGLCNWVELNGFLVLDLNSGQFAFRHVVVTEVETEVGRSRVDFYGFSELVLGLGHIVRPKYEQAMADVGITAFGIN